MILRNRKEFKKQQAISECKICRLFFKRKKIKRITIKRLEYLKKILDHNGLEYFKKWQFKLKIS